VKTVLEKPTSSGNPCREESLLLISSSPGRKPSEVDQPTTTEAATKLHQQEKFINAIEWLKKCIHFTDTIT